MHVATLSKQSHPKTKAPFKFPNHPPLHTPGLVSSFCNLSNFNLNLVLSLCLHGNDGGMVVGASSGTKNDTASR